MKLVIGLVQKYSLQIAFLQAWAATLGSLYFSEVQNLRPCLLCWYQRILMYPLAIILAVALFRKDRNVAYYALPLAIIGWIIALYQYLLQMTTLSKVAPSCDPFYGDCSKIDFIFLGFVTIPFLSLLAFSVIILMMLFSLRFKK